MQEGPRRSQGWRSRRQEKVASRLFLVDQVISGAYNKFVVNLHKEQTSKLQAKNQQELDLLDDIRNFMKQKAAIEKHYAEGLLKLSSVYGTKKIATVGGKAKISQMSKRVKCKFVSSSIYVKKYTFFKQTSNETQQQLIIKSSDLSHGHS